jgi:hypothetical protein
MTFKEWLKLVEDAGHIPGGAGDYNNSAGGMPVRSKYMADDKPMPKSRCEADGKCDKQMGFMKKKMKKKMTK